MAKAPEAMWKARDTMFDSEQPLEGEMQDTLDCVVIGGDWSDCRGKS